MAGVSHLILIRKCDQPGMHSWVTWGKINWFLVGGRAELHSYWSTRVHYTWRWRKRRKRQRYCTVGRTQLISGTLTSELAPCLSGILFNLFLFDFSWFCCAIFMVKSIIVHVKFGNLKVHQKPSLYIFGYIHFSMPMLYNLVVSLNLPQCSAF